MMGSPACEWGHPRYAENEVEVTLTHDFVMKQTEVTQAEWTALGIPNPSRSDGPRHDGPEPSSSVGNMTWYEALEFANQLSARDGYAKCYALDGCDKSIGAGMICASVKNVDASIYDCRGYRLPTEAEWEYAARAGTRWATYAGDLHSHSELSECDRNATLDGIAWYCANAGDTTHPVKGLASNPWGLFDIAGNAGEMTTGVFNPDGYDPNVHADPGASVAVGVQTIVRGGTAVTGPLFARSAYRFPVGPQFRTPAIGFRLVRSLQ